MPLGYVILLAACVPVFAMIYSSNSLYRACFLPPLFTGRLALKLVEMNDMSMHRSAVIAVVYFAILGTVEPFQSSVEAYSLGRKVGEQTVSTTDFFVFLVRFNVHKLHSFLPLQGDFLYTTLNWIANVHSSYLAGDCLENVRTNSHDFIMRMQRQKTPAFIGGTLLLYYQTCVLREGLSVLNVKNPNNMPTEAETLKLFSIHPDVSNNYKVYRLERAYLFRQQALDDVSLGMGINIDHDPRQSSIFLYGTFFKGMASYLLARQTSDGDKRTGWIEKGDNALAIIKYWSEHSSWNWKSKLVLLEAEKLHTVGNSEQASLLYEKAIRLAREHKFINDEAIASELAGLFFCERGLSDIKAGALLLHSVQCYKTWGALAVARRVETFTASKYGSDCTLQQPNSALLESIFASNEDSSISKKRQVET